MLAVAAEILLPTNPILSGFSPAALPAHCSSLTAVAAPADVRRVHMSYAATAVQVLNSWVPNCVS